MQRKVSAWMIPALLMAGAAHAEIYNKDGNKLDLYGKSRRPALLSLMTPLKMATETYMRLGFKGETQINDMMTGYAQWEYKYSG